MGDCDLTYDFREVRPFIERLEAGADFVMGSRFRGYVEPGAMPKLHRYFGTPLTTWILNLIYGTRYSDIHCGMRAITRESLERMQLKSQSWEYASEMVLKAALLRLRIDEVPVRFYRDREGRVSHHKRVGWFSPWVAGWINLRAMFLYAPDFFLKWPGLILFVLGMVLTLSLARGPISLFGVGLDLHTMLLGMTMTTLGTAALQLAILARAYHDFAPEWRRDVARWLTYERGVLTGLALGAVGFALDASLLIHWLSSGLRLSEISHLGVLGLLLLILGFQTFTFTLLFQIVHQGHEGSRP
jgi:hypothetical protein